jgi:long-chain fatty acid transport protein
MTLAHRISIRAVLVGALAASFAGTARLDASAFAINELGARAQGMGGAFTSIADDASAIFFNPAGLAFQRGTQLEMDNLVVVGQFRFFPSDPPPGQQIPEKGFHGSIKPKFIPVANLYFSKGFGERWTFGFGGFAPFGLAANYTNFNDGDPANTKYPGRFAGTRAALQSFWFQPTLAYKISKNQSIGVGVALVYTHLFLEQSILNPYDIEDPDAFSLELAADVFPGVDPKLAFASFARLLPEGRFRAAATAKSPGFSAGYLYKQPEGKWQFGAMWRSSVVHHLRGKASFAFNSDGALFPFLPKDRGLYDLFPNQGITGTLVTPATYVLGFSKPFFWNGTIAFDFRTQDFHRFKDLPINFSRTHDSQGRKLATPAEQRLDFNFHNSYLLQLGYEKPINPKTDLRVGYVFDHSPVPDESVGPLFPDNNRHSFTVGATRLVGGMELTLFYQAMQMVNRTVSVPANAFQFTNGDYRNFVHLAGAGLRLHLGKQQ